MDTVKYTLHFFFLALGMGTYLFYPLVDTKLTGAGFLRLVLTILISGLTLSFCVGFFIDPFFNLNSYILYASSITLALIIYRTHQDEATKLLKINKILLSITLLVLSYTFHRSFESFGYFLLTMTFIGICHYTMILGHYYLVVPKLTEKPLLVSLKILWVLILFKFILAVLTTNDNLQLFNSGVTEVYGYTFNWIIFLMRFLWGFFALGILSYFGYRLSAMRSIQSATGVFYIMVFFIFIGELISIYTFYETGLML